MDKQHFHFSYLGNRNYVQSSQLLQFLEKIIAERQLPAETLSLKIGTALFSELDYAVSDEPCQEKFDAVCTLDCSGFQKYVYFFNGAKKDAEHIDDDTEVLVNSLRVVFIEDILQVQGQIAFQDFFKVLIEANKQYVRKITGFEEKWLVAQVDALLPVAFSEPVRQIEIKKINCIAGAIVRSNFFVNGKEAGMTVYRRI